MKGICESCGKAIAGQLLYRRGNLMGTWDQLICDALRDEYQADVALSPGFRSPGFVSTWMEEFTPVSISHEASGLQVPASV